MLSYPVRFSVPIHQSRRVFPPKQNNCCSRGDGYHGPSYLRLDTAGQEPHLIRPAALLRCEKASQAALIPPVARPAGSAW